MTITPIRGRRVNIRAELLELANDPTVTGIAVGVIRGDPADDSEVIQTISIGKRATRANLSMIAISFAFDAISDAEI
jgi:hypothetical protein